MKAVSNITTGWKTSLAGLVVIGAAVYSVFAVDGITWFPEATIGIAVGSLLLVSPDSAVTAAVRLIKRFSEK